MAKDDDNQQEAEKIRKQVEAAMAKRAALQKKAEEIAEAIQDEREK